MTSSMKRILALVALLALESCGGGPAMVTARITGDWDYERMLGAAPNGGFEARRRFGFAHFDGPTATGAWLKRRSGDPLETISSVELKGDALVLSLGGDRSIRATVNGDTIAGQILQAGQPIDRVWLTRRTAPPVWEPPYPLWPGPVSESTFKVTIDPAVPMKARDGVTLMSYVARPVGNGPFGVVMERTLLLRTDRANGEFWASRGYIYVKQDVRGRGGSGGVLDMNALQEQDGYDAVEWAAALPGSSKEELADRARLPGSHRAPPSRSRHISRRSPPWSRRRIQSVSCRTSTWCFRRPSCRGSASRP